MEAQVTLLHLETVVNVFVVCLLCWCFVVLMYCLSMYCCSLPCVELWIYPVTSCTLLYKEFSLVSQFIGQSGLTLQLFQLNSCNVKSDWSESPGKHIKYSYLILYTACNILFISYFKHFLHYILYIQHIVFAIQTMHLTVYTGCNIIFFIILILFEV